MTTNIFQNEMWRIRHCATLTPQPSKPLDDSEFVSFLPMEAIGEDGSVSLDEIINVGEAKSGYTFFENQDVVIAKITPCFENGKGALVRNLVGGKGFGTTELHVLRPKANMDARFLWWVTASPSFRDQGTATMLGAGGQKRVTPEFILDYRIDLPSLEAQRKIADYLDRETANIDSLIEEKEHFIKLLGERRQALITEAVTRGVASNVPLKESGLPWLGCIPAHWDIVNLRWIVGMQSGEGITSDKIEESGTYPVYGGNGFRGYSKDFTHEGTYALVGRQGAQCGNVHIATGRFWASEHAVVVTPRRPMSVNWLAEVLRLMNLNQYSVAAAQPGLAVDRIMSLQIPIPPVEEQHAIAKVISAVSKVDEEMIQLNIQLIDALKSRRSALIHETTTGQIAIGSAA